ncbi:MAG: caspase family protein, partial [Thermoanaerobaculia bacterium]|nr:caspase family protein [Thermoanaerobaculia bacterium]
MGLSRVARLLILLAVFAAEPGWREAQAAGKKHAVIVGINAYAGSPLYGCVKDAQNVKRVLTNTFGFPSENVRMLLDRAATRVGILSALRDVSERVSAGDVLVFYYSGHGTVFPDADSDLQDETVTLQANAYIPRTGKYDSAICPVDSGEEPVHSKPWENLILDDELYEIFAPLTGKGVTVISFSDSCHSGSLGRGLGEGVKARFLEPRNAIRRDLSQPASRGPARPGTSKYPVNTYLAFGGCRDDQVSGDMPQGGRFTVSLISAIQTLAREGASALTYRRVYETTRREVLAATRQEQNPSVDDRFFGPGLDTLMFAPAGQSDPETVDTSPDVIERIVVRVLDERAAPVRGAVFAVLPPDFPRGQPIQAKSALLLGKTDEKGIYDSGKVSFKPGAYEAKVVADGFRKFEGRVQVQSSRNRSDY